MMGGYVWGRVGGVGDGGRRLLQVPATGLARRVWRRVGGECYGGACVGRSWPGPAWTRGEAGGGGAVGA